MYIVSLACRYLLCLIPYLILVSNKSIIYHITGPITIPPFNESKGPLIYWIAAIEFFRVFYTPIISLALKLFPKKQSHFRSHQSIFMTNMCMKYGMVLVMKLFIVFYEFHRLKYYLHVFFLELFIIAVNVLADVVGNQKVSLVMDIVLVDALNRVAIFYELTRTFNPNFGLYFFGNNLLSLISYMLEGDRKQVLYVRHDIYRIMIVTMGYLFLFSLFQLSITYRPLIIFLLTAFFFYETIQHFSSEQIVLEPPPELPKRPKLPSYRNFDNFFLPPVENQKIKEENGLLSIKDLKGYVSEIRKKKALLNFLLVAIITIFVEFLFIYIQPKQQDKKYYDEHHMVRNTFMDFYEATMANKSIG